MKFASVEWLAALVVLSIACGVSGETYTRQLTDGFTVSWSVDVSTNTLSLTLEAATGDGWLGFGIGEPATGSMPGADVMVYAADPSGAAGTARVLTDRHTLGFFEPVRDADTSEDIWTLVGVESDSETTVLRVTRPLTVPEVECSFQDRSIPPGVVNVVAAWGSATPFLSYHLDNRVASQITFYRADGQDPTKAVDFPEDPDTVHSLDIVFPEFEVSDETTAYYCMSIELPFEEDVHIIGSSSIWSENESDALVHHWLVYSCAPGGRYDDFLTPGRCDLENGGLGCVESVAGWAPGAPDGDFLPPEAGFRAGPSREALKYVLVEFHFDNPKHIAGLTATPGVSLFYTTALRQYDAGTLIVGDVSFTFDPIPPGRQAVHYESVCPSVCTQRFDEPLNVFGIALHAHLVGSMVWNTLHRNNADVGEFMGRTEFYNFNFQRIVGYNPPIVINPGDRINTHCVYNTMGRSEPTVFDEASQDEMCLSFLSYYPRQPKSSLCGHSAGLTMCGDITELNDLVFRRNPGRDAEGTRDIGTIFGNHGGICTPEYTVSGMVYYDDNQNGVHDDDEPIAPRAFVKAFDENSDAESDLYRSNRGGEFQFKLEAGTYLVGSRDSNQSHQGTVVVDIQADTTVYIGLVPRT